MDLLEPTKEVTLKSGHGDERTFRIGSFPAIAGREIVTQYPHTAMPKIGEYKANEDLMVKLMGYAERVFDDGEPIRLSSRTLIDNHVPDFEMLMKLEWAIMEHNCSFFRNGVLSSVLERGAAAVPDLLTSLIVTVSQRLSSARDSRPSSS